MSSKTLSATDIKWSDRFHQCESICEEKKCPKRLIDCLLDIGDLVSASHVHTFFESNHQVLNNAPNNSNPVHLNILSIIME